MTKREREREREKKKPAFGLVLKCAKKLLVTQSRRRLFFPNFGFLNFLAFLENKKPKVVFQKGGFEL